MGGRERDSGAILYVPRYMVVTLPLMDGGEGGVVLLFLPACLESEDVRGIVAGLWYLTAVKTTEREKILVPWPFCNKDKYLVVS